MSGGKPTAPEARKPEKAKEAWGEGTSAPSTSAGTSKKPSLFSCFPCFGGSKKSDVYEVSSSEEQRVSPPPPRPSSPPPPRPSSPPPPRPSSPPPTPALKRQGGWFFNMKDTGNPLSKVPVGPRSSPQSLPGGKKKPAGKAPRTGSMDGRYSGLASDTMDPKSEPIFAIGGELVSLNEGRMAETPRP